ncbi:hypothetical protein EC2749250_0359 [Escherichia coli 2749250]|nr:hypothetical protein EC2749250_0359 [Escherichia coli 2749250]
MWQVDAHLKRLQRGIVRDLSPREWGGNGLLMNDPELYNLAA